MALLMTVFFENGFSEIISQCRQPQFSCCHTPLCQRIKRRTDLKRASVGRTLAAAGFFPVFTDLKKGDPVESADLKDGTVIEGMVRKTELYFSVKIDRSRRKM